VSTVSVQVVKRLLNALVMSTPPAAYGSMVGSVPAVLAVDPAEDEFDARFPSAVPAR
jgi:hypothetical protein